MASILCTEMPQPEPSSAPPTTKSGRPRKKDKWADMLKLKDLEYNVLLRKVEELEDEQRSLRVKEGLLLQVLDILEALVADAASRAPPSLRTAGTSPQDHDAEDRSLMWLMVVSAVQAREAEIRSAYGQLLSSLYPSHQQQLSGIELLKAICSPEYVPRVCSMTTEQLTARLSVLAGKCALQLMRHAELTPGVDPATASVTGALHDTHMEFSALCMSAMTWRQDKFGVIINTNLDTLQPFDEPLPADHWRNALQQVQLTDQQLQVLSCLHDKHYWAGILKLKEQLASNIQQQAVNTEALTSLLQHDNVQQHQKDQTEDAGSSGHVQEEERAADLPTAGACVVRVNQLQEAQEDLMAEQGRLLQKWVLLGLHVGIVTACTMSTYQQAMFMAACYPSIPRIDMAMAAYREDQDKLRQQQQQQQPQRASTAEGKGRRSGASSTATVDGTSPGSSL